VIIIGAGMAGLLAARMLGHHKVAVWEKQTALPNNHHAVLRFRTSQVGDILGIPFKRVNMIKDVLPWQNPIADSLAYSYKNTSAYRSDRSVTKGLVSEERYIAPPDLIERMAEGVQIEFGREYAPGDPHVRGASVISTMPMPSLMEALDYDMAPDFEYQSGMVIEATVENCDAYVSLLIPNPDEPFSRISLTGNQLLVEVPKVEKLAQYESFAQHAAKVIGIRSEQIHSIRAPRYQSYNKILPIADEARKGFMFWATKNFSVYSLGRYATWRPSLLLDDLVNDIRLIDKWTRSSGYDMALHVGR
jgi:hypothetical protein